jgi:Glycogen debranching enzyme
MTSFSDWTRRRFLARTAAAGVFSASPIAQLLAQGAAAKRLRSAGDSPEVISGGIRPLLEDNTSRPLRYVPDNGDFLITNGREFFNRPLYGPNNAFRVDAGDLPEFSLYLPGHGGNLRIGIANGINSKWAFQADRVTARYRPGRMIYEVRDSLLGSGGLQVELMTQGEGSGIHVAVTPRDIATGALLTWAFGGVSGRKGRRNGDIGCEVEPVSQFFQLRAEECAGNSYKIEGSTAHQRSHAANLQLSFPPGSTLGTASAVDWNAGWKALANSPDGELPILTGSVKLETTPLYIAIRRILPEENLTISQDPAAAFTTRSQQITAIASAVQFTTPDAYINAAIPALNIAADALWDARQQCVMHGAVAWRNPLAGWRGPYALDALGNHARMKQQLRHWIARQNTSPIRLGTDDSPATGPADPGTHLSRKESLLHSNGDLSHNHYDMNLVFFDALLRHLRWTGDLEFAREVWPALNRHIQWEQRLFRRSFADPRSRSSEEKLPLYEAYACIWASDNLQYNGGGAAHSSAYNFFLNKTAAVVARLLKEDAAPYETEAALIQEAMQKLLWLPEQGAFAESKDILGLQTTYSNPALWTMYHTIDSEVPSARQSWQMAAERLASLRHVPIHGTDVPSGDWFLLPCSDWLPYVWSLNLLILAENAHTALALWQTGMRDEAFALLKGNLLDSMFMGLCPGNLHMTSQLDVHRQEAQRDFGDPIGITSRALVEGLYGIQPDLLHNVLTIRPGFPSSWNEAALHHPDVDFTWHRDGLHETIEIVSRLPKPVALTLILPASTTTYPAVVANGRPVAAHFDTEAVGIPRIRIELAAATIWKLTIRWHGVAPPAPPPLRTCRLNERVPLPLNLSYTHLDHLHLDDPQGCLRDGLAIKAGHHTIFARIEQQDCRYWLPITFQVTAPPLLGDTISPVKPADMVDPIELAPFFEHRLNEIFTRSYVAPRSAFCSLALPETLLGGWANFDQRATVDDTGLRNAGGTLQTSIHVPFLTPSGASAPNCAFISQWEIDQQAIEFSVSGHARTLYLLMTGTTYPQATHMPHGTVTATYKDGISSKLILRTPDTWWPIEQDYLLDDYLFIDDAPLPPRVDLSTGETRLLNHADFKGKGRSVPGGSATVLSLALHPERELASVKIECDLYGVVLALVAATLVR